MPCCRDPQSLTKGPSPFARILALGFYDGPTSGVLQCRACAQVYKYDMLDWDEDHNIRIFRLALLPADALDRCVKILAPNGPPRWPVWVPMTPQPPSQEAAAYADQEVQGLLEEAQPAELVVAWSGYGERVLAAKRIPAAELVRVPDWFSADNATIPADWFSVLGLVRTHAGVLDE